MRLLLLFLVACGSSRSSAPVTSSAPAASTTCAADGLGALTNKGEYDTACLAEGASCKQQCDAGDGDACVLHAHALGRAEGDAIPAYTRACRLGVANACTNLGATIWLGRQPAPPEDKACARRLFDRACEVRERFGCGMVGRMMAYDAKTPEQREDARTYFDATCTQLGAMSCRMYAFHLERGDLGPHEPATVKALMLRACETGDDDACGHDTAAETFR